MSEWHSTLGKETLSGPAGLVADLRCGADAGDAEGLERLVSGKCGAGWENGLVLVMMMRGGGILFALERGAEVWCERGDLGICYT